jgi:hypothetical protein
MELIDHVSKAYSYAEAGISKVSRDILELEGLSGVYTRHFYNNLCSMPNARYLEIGTWKGSSVCSAMFGNQMACVCIDNWSQCGGPKDEFIQNFTRFKGLNDATFYESDCWSPQLIESLKDKKFNIYLYDGEHSEESHYKALIHYLPCLDDTFIYVVDDWNDNNIRRGTMRAIQDANLEMLWKQETRLTFDGTHTEMSFGKRTWWNGIGIFVLRRGRE